MSKLRGLRGLLELRGLQSCASSSVLSPESLFFETIDVIVAESRHAPPCAFPALLHGRLWSEVSAGELATIEVADDCLT